MTSNTYMALFYDNSDGEGIEYLVECRLIDKEVCYEDGKPLVQYRGDRILKLWKLDETTECRQTCAYTWESIDNPPLVNQAIDVLLKDDSGKVVYGCYYPCFREFDARGENHFCAEFWSFLN